MMGIVIIIIIVTMTQQRCNTPGGIDRNESMSQQSRMNKNKINKATTMSVLCCCCYSIVFLTEFCIVLLLLLVFRLFIRGCCDMLSFRSIPPGVLHLCCVIVARRKRLVDDDDDDMATEVQTINSIRHKILAPTIFPIHHPTGSSLEFFRAPLHNLRYVTHTTIYYHSINSHLNLLCSFFRTTIADF